MPWKNIDFEKRTIQIGGIDFKTKNKKTRLVPFCGVLENLLLELFEKEKNYNPEYLLFRKFVIDSIGLNINYVSKNFKRASLKAGMNKRIHFHSLRHSYASNLAQAGVPLLNIKELLGHSTILVTEIYTHNRFDELQRAVESVFGPPKISILKKVI